jgi:hypothetical protein
LTLVKLLHGSQQQIFAVTLPHLSSTNLLQQIPPSVVHLDDSLKALPEFHDPLAEESTQLLQEHSLSLSIVEVHDVNHKTIACHLRAIF